MGQKAPSRQNTTFQKILLTLYLKLLDIRENEIIFYSNKGMFESEKGTLFMLRILGDCALPPLGSAPWTLESTFAVEIIHFCFLNKRRLIQIPPAEANVI